MECSRLFLVGLIILFLGIQLRMVKTYELNEPASRFVEQKILKSSGTAQPVSLGYADDWLDLPPVTGPRLHSVTPPRWLGWSLISVGAVLVLTCPCFRR